MRTQPAAVHYFRAHPTAQHFLNKLAQLPLRLLTRAAVQIQTPHARPMPGHQAADIILPAAIFAKRTWRLVLAVGTHVEILLLIPFHLIKPPFQRLIVFRRGHPITVFQRRNLAHRRRKIRLVPTLPLSLRRSLFLSPLRLLAQLLQQLLRILFIHYPAPYLISSFYPAIL